MPAPPRYGPPDGNDELRQYARLAAATFAGDPETMLAWVRNLGQRNIRLLRAGGEIAAGLCLYDMGQYFGGRSVPIWGLAGVALPPHRRGQGAGRELLLANLCEQYAAGPPLATLYPATTRLYRELGYELAGLRTIARLRPLELEPGQADTALRARPLEAADWPALRDVYARFRASENGCLDRNAEIWERLRHVPPGTLLQGQVFEGPRGLEGYLLFTLTRREGSMRLAMQVRDWACATAGAQAALLRQLWVQRSVVEELTLAVAPHDPLLRGVMHNQDTRIVETLAWMLRVVRVRDALDARGWPAVSAQAEFTVEDPLLPDNRGPWRLSIESGRAKVRRARSAGVLLHARALAALFSGFASVPALRRTGLLTGTARHDAALAAMFAGGMAWLPDYF